MNGDRDIDRRDAVKGIISDYLDKETRDQERRKKAAAERLKLGRLRFYLRAAGILVILLLAAYIAFTLMSESGAFGGRTYWAVGKEGRMDAGTEECIGNMWRIRKAIDAYYERSREYPDILGALYGDYLAKRYGVCPAGGKAYVFGEKDGRIVFFCPDPGKHGLAAIWCDVKGGAPVVEKK